MFLWNPQGGMRPCHLPVSVPLQAAHKVYFECKIKHLLPFPSTCGSCRDVDISIHLENYYFIVFVFVIESIAIAVFLLEKKK